MARKFFYDTEFHEQGPETPIELISIGIVSETGEEFYRVWGDVDWISACVNPWLRDNVVAHLPGEFTVVNGFTPNWDDPSVASWADIQEAVLAFLKPTEEDPVELWAWYADYDHVVLSQLFGTMIELPPGMPMYTHDLKQAVDMLDRLLQDGTLGEPYEGRAMDVDPEHAGTPQAKPYFGDMVRNVEVRGQEHNALADARQVWDRWTYLKSFGGITL